MFLVGGINYQTEHKERLAVNVIQRVTKVEHRRLGRIRLINQPVKLSRTPAKLATASPERGEHTDEVLREAGYSESEISDLRTTKAI